jgi:hypothetical protein
MKTVIEENPEHQYWPDQSQPIREINPYTHSESANYEFTTLTCIPGVIEVNIINFVNIFKYSMDKIIVNVIPIREINPY